MKRTFGVLLGLLLTGLAAAGATNDITGALQRGLFEEEANHNLAAAIQAYESVIERFDKDRKLAATAVFRLGECYRKQGRTNDALVQYRRVVSEFADQSAVVNLSRQHLAASGVTAEVAEGGGPSPEQLEKAEIERLSRLILESPDLVNAKSAEGLTPLQQAVVKGQFQVAEYLLAKGAQADSKALSLAIGRGDRAMVEFLIQKGAPLDSGTPLHLAAQKGYRSIAELLIEKGANVNAIDSPARETPLHIAAKNGFRSTAELLLQKGAGVNAMSALGTPLHAAVQSGQEALVAMLLEAKPDLEKTYQGYTPLHSAVNRGNLQIAELLLKAGADVNSDKYNQAGQVRTPLMDAVETGNLPMTDLLLRFKADPNRPSYPGSSNPLKIAINKSNLALVKLLLEAGADIQSEPILTYDTTLGSPAIVKTLLDRGAAINQPGVNGASALMLAAQNRLPDTVKLLLAHKADPNARDLAGHTAMHYVSFNPDSRRAEATLEIVDALISAGADVNALANDGTTPLKRAENWKYEKISELLKSKGAQLYAPNFQAVGLTRERLEQPLVMFRKDNRDWNHYTALEVIYSYYQRGPASPQSRSGHLQQGGLLPFPDFAGVQIRRPRSQKPGDEEIIPLNLTTNVDCSKDVLLKFGDLVEVPERVHSLAEAPVALDRGQQKTIEDCLRRKIRVVTATRQIELTTLPAYLPEVLHRPEVQQMLTSTSDLSRVKIKSVHPVTRQPRETVVNMREVPAPLPHPAPAPPQLGTRTVSSPSQPQEIRLWLRDGDIVEVPEK